MAHNLLNYAATSHGQKYYQVPSTFLYFLHESALELWRFKYSPRFKSKLFPASEDDFDMFKSEQTIHSKRHGDFAKRQNVH